MFKEHRYSERNLSLLSNITSYLVCFVICLFSFQNRKLTSYTRWCYLRILLVNTVHHLKALFFRSGSSHHINDDAPYRFFLWSPYITCGFLFSFQRTQLQCMMMVLDSSTCDHNAPLMVFLFSFRGAPIVYMMLFHASFTCDHHTSLVVFQFVHDLYMTCTIKTDSKKRKTKQYQWLLSYF